jgi:hypothetical protein
MSEPKPQSFEEKAQKSADAYDDYQTDSHVEIAFYSGASWARSITVQEVLDLLRSEEAISEQKSEIKHYGKMLWPKDWANYIEDEMKKRGAL